MSEDQTSGTPTSDNAAGSIRWSDLSSGWGGSTRPSGPSACWRLSHREWKETQVFFVDQGLSILKSARVSTRQPSCRSTIDRRAGCGRSARPVRREGGLKPMSPPYPYIADHLAKNTASPRTPKQWQG